MEQSILLSLTKRFPAYIAIHASILKCIAAHMRSLDAVRSSVKLLTVLDAVINESVAKELSICSMQTSVKSRLNHYVKFMVTLLCVPFFSSIIGEGKGISLESGSNLQSVQQLIADMLSLFVTAELLNDSNTDLSMLDKALVELALSLIFYRSSAFVPLLLTISQHGKDIISCITGQLLSVRALSRDIEESVELVIEQCSDVLSYYEEAQRGSASISTSDIERTIDRGLSVLMQTDASGQEMQPSDVVGLDTRQVLRAPLLEYIVWLREHREKLVRVCRVAEVTTFLDGQLVKQLKQEEYRSPEEVVYVYGRKYKSRLSVIPLPVQPTTMFDVKQAEKDVCREVFSVNNILMDQSFEGSEEAKQCSKLTVGSTPWGEDNLSLRTLQLFIQWNLEKALCFQFEFGQVLTASGASVASAEFNDREDRYSNADMDGMLELERSSDGGIDTNVVRDDEKDDSAMPPDYAMGFPIVGNILNMSNIHSVEKLIVDRLMRQILIACSRTIAAGDAYTVIYELYAGSGLVLCPRTAPIMKRTDEPDELKSSDSHATISLHISAKGICVVVKSYFDLFEIDHIEGAPEEVIYRKNSERIASNDANSSAMLLPEEKQTMVDRSSVPLMSFKAKTTTIVAFKELNNAITPSAGNNAVGRPMDVAEKPLMKGNTNIRDTRDDVYERERIPSDGSLRRATRDSVLKGLQNIYLEEPAAKLSESAIASDEKRVGIRPKSTVMQCDTVKRKYNSAFEQSLRLLQADCDVHRALQIEPFLG